MPNWSVIGLTCHEHYCNVVVILGLEEDIFKVMKSYYFDLTF